MDPTFIARYWYASVYEQFENETEDVAFLLKALAEQTSGPQNILEVACGGGRICVSLAQVGHRVSGFDADEHMLARVKLHSNLRTWQADAITADWGVGYDVVAIAGNFLINIESDTDYAEAQQTLIRKAAAALKPGGHLYLDFDLCADPAKRFNRLGEYSYFKGVDELGTSGRTVTYGSVYNPVTRMCVGSNHWEITPKGGEMLVISEVWRKHIPTQAQVYGWLRDEGLAIERTWKNFTDEALSEPVDGGTGRATIWAEKRRSDE